jgi:superfamily II DNA helicase RecQ
MNDEAENTEKFNNKLRDFAERLRAKERKNLKPTVALPSINDMLTEGEKMLKDEKTLPPSTTKTKKMVVRPSNKNPYVQARRQILTEYAEWRRDEVARMEKTGDTNNRHYEAFVKSVMELGDQLSNKG